MEFLDHPHLGSYMIVEDVLFPINEVAVNLFKINFQYFVFDLLVHCHIVVVCDYFPLMEVAEQPFANSISGDVSSSEFVTVQQLRLFGSVELICVLDDNIHVFLDSMTQ
jgi:hypothetical protein